MAVRYKRRRILIVVACVCFLMIFICFLPERSSLQDSTNDGADCTLDYINTNRLEQDHPCVISFIRRHYLRAPSSEGKLHLERPHIVDPSAGQTGNILKLLRNKTSGFFLECGALDGEYLSNTLYMERFLDWTGILIEADPVTFRKLTTKNRKSWALPVCVSLHTYPTRVSFKIDEALGHIEEAAVEVSQKITSAQCFPLYSILLAANRTSIDFFSLDVEGHELKVLKTIPWDKVDIKSLAVEWEHIAEGRGALQSFMEANGYIKVEDVAYEFAKDSIFLKF